MTTNAQPVVIKRELADANAGVAGAAQEPAKKAAKAAADKRSECTHTVAVPTDWQAAHHLEEATYGTLEEPRFDPARYAKQYPFQLDPFQATAIACLEREESVMVAAHTSAGKTVVAEYAIAKALAEKQRVIYTSPLKALSNQKFRELSEEFGDVGLMTGDVTLHEDASCIVMTTEILRSMLYRHAPRTHLALPPLHCSIAACGNELGTACRGGEMMREIVWVIFDEIHYMQDRDRGVVWEEAIITLPRACRMVFLSATLANAYEFATWVAKLHSKPCHVVYTEFRPTPLEHFALPCTEGSEGGNKGGLYRLCTHDGKFLTKMWEDLSAAGMLKQPWQPPDEAQAAAAPDVNSKQSAARPKRSGEMIGDRIADVMEMVQEKELFPIIVFSFNRIECEQFAMNLLQRGKKLGGKLDFTTADEKAAIDLIYENAIAELGEDRDLRAVTKIQQFIKLGIGFHHGGLIPLVKELIEILFQEGLLKVLFATETFAMGLNMPARTVLFTTYFKNDGVRTRALTSGEYIQMSGRAGRRGKDKRGYVLLLVEDPDKFSPTVAKQLISGRPMPLMSRFRLSYYTLLNLSKRREGGMAHMEYLIAHSFQQHQLERQGPRLQARIAEIDEQLASSTATGVGVEIAEEFARLKDEQAAHNAVVHAAMMHPAVLKPFLVLGRLVRIQEGSTDWRWGVVLQCSFKPAADAEAPHGAQPGAASAAPEAQAANWQVMVMLSVNSKSKAAGSILPEPLGSKEAEMLAVPVPMLLIVAVSSCRLEVEKDLRQTSAKKRLQNGLKQLVEDRFGGADKVPKLHPVQDMGLKSDKVKHAMECLADIDAKLANNALMRQESNKEQQLLAKLQDLALERAQLQARVAKSHLDEFQEEVVKRRKVLRRLNHITEDGLLTAKGKAAAEIDTADELMTAELMFNAVWQQLKTPAALVALLSCLVPCKEKEKSSDTQVALPVELANTYGLMQEYAESLARVSNECGIEVDEDEYAAGFTANLMNSLHAWALGATFADVTARTSIMEGTLIRCARRLMELMHQVVYAADKVGEAEMKARVEAALARLQRGIMFCGSLYLAGQ